MAQRQAGFGPLAPDNDRQIKAAQQLAKMLDNAGIETEYHDDVLSAIWQKACFNVAMNGISALADASPEADWRYASIA